MYKSIPKVVLGFAQMPDVCEQNLGFPKPHYLPNLIVLLIACWIKSRTFATPWNHQKVMCFVPMPLCSRQILSKSIQKVRVLWGFSTGLKKPARGFSRNDKG